MKTFMKEFKEFVSRGNVMDMAVNKVSRKKEEEPLPATTKVCPYCREEVAVEAVRCLIVLQN